MLLDNALLFAINTMLSKFLRLLYESASGIRADETTHSF